MHLLLHYRGGAKRRLLFFVFLLNGCSILDTPEARLNHALSLANPQGFKKTLHPTSSFTLFALEKITRPSVPHAVIYIEGDGFAWLNRYHPSDDPTPRDPLVLRLAILERCPNVIYLGRPCQYVLARDKARCVSDFWTHARFNETVITAYQEVLKRLQQHYGFRTFTLIGYSGGGTIGALVAARETAVVKLITIAGNMDTPSWVKIHQLTPLYSSLNPSDYAQTLKSLPQLHYVGTQDDVVPLAVTHAYMQALGNPPQARIIEVENAHHEEGWEPFFSEQPLENRCPEAVAKN